MNRIKSILLNPVSWIVGLLLAYSVYQNLAVRPVSDIVRSDGRGYYAYLPAMLIYNDPSYQSSLKAEQENSKNYDSPVYLFGDNKGHICNKYFPGVSVLQLPFFGIACAVSWITGSPIDGYSPIFILSFYLGSLFYLLAGILLFIRMIRRLYPETSRLNYLLVIAIFTSTCLLFYLTLTPSFSHLYSFFLFAALANIVLSLRRTVEYKKLFLLGLILGLIFIVRPTNITVVLMIPFLLGSLQTLTSKFIEIMRSWRNILILLLGFLAVAIVLPITWKWQTGSWFVWSYSGEGMDLTSPEIFRTLFSFRAGLFLHTPIMFVAVIGLVILFLKKKYLAFWWTSYFLINLWIISSWWCWDYESSFGIRAMSEHFIFIALPLFYFAEKYRKTTIAVVIVCSIVGLIRLGEFTSGFMSDQRFTRDNYLPSLCFWESKNYGRWNFTKSCVPKGKLVHQLTLLAHPGEFEIKAQDIFSLTNVVTLPKSAKNQRYYFVVDLEKKINSAPLKDVFLVVDGHSSKNAAKRHYQAIALYNDRFEGEGAWTTLSFEGQVYDFLKEYDKVGMYFWNPGKQTFSLKDIRMRLEVYQ